MVIADTNIVSALMRATPEPEVVNWLDRQPRESVWTTSITLYEVRFGIQIMDLGKRQKFLADGFERIMTQIFQGRIISFDVAAARYTADIMASRQKQGRSGDIRDSMIAGIALATRATIATRNTRHFEDLDIPLVNPWKT